MVEIMNNNPGWDNGVLNDEFVIPDLRMRSR